ncbi:hypothetical protein TNCT_179371 [Trichonephila clavata]|uniref:Uncharacterized protein n=1 Tax=Trichonephila clavata TaxID=2740835 RepID=A0A8X6GGZ0_TRICU|nr:hypothetical protein TNCT_179371 [Trichonephila clavata]
MQKPHLQLHPHGVTNTFFRPQSVEERPVGTQVGQRRSQQRKKTVPEVPEPRLLTHSRLGWSRTVVDVGQMPACVFRADGTEIRRRAHGRNFNVGETRL